MRAFPPAAGSLVAVVVVPGTPLLVPELATGAAGELASLRAAAIAATTWLDAVTSGHWGILAAGDGPSPGPGASGNLRGFGLDVPVSLGPGASVAQGGLADRSVLLGAWLREAGAPASTVPAYVVDPGTGAQDGPPSLAPRPPEGPPLLGLLVVADGPNALSARAPAGGDLGVQEAAASAWGELLEALATPALKELAAVEPDRWRAVGSDAAEPLGIAARAMGGGGSRHPVAASLDHQCAPYGVGYAVARWWR